MIVSRFCTNDRIKTTRPIITSTPADVRVTLHTSSHSVTSTSSKKESTSYPSRYTKAARAAPMIEAIKQASKSLSYSFLEV